MTFFSLLCALLLEQMLPLPSNNPVWKMQQRLDSWTLDSFDTGRPMHGWLIWALTVSVPAMAAWLVYRLLLLVGWPLALAWNVLMLYLTLGFRQFSDYAAAICDALERGDDITARQLLTQWKGSPSAELARHEITQHVLEHSVLDVHRRVFGPVASFVLFSMLGLGPAGAVLYRCSDFVRSHWQQRQQAEPSGNTQALQAAHTAWQWVNWLPIRLTAACFAAVGNFELAVDNWRQTTETATGNTTRSQNEAILLAVAAGAIDVPGNFGTRAPMPTTTDLQTTASPDPTLAENAALSYSTSLHPRQPSGMSRLHMLARLIWRSVLLWGMLIALVTVTHWIS